MYNQNEKEMYIKEKILTTVISPYYLNSLFEKTKIFEEKNKKDVCNFTYYEIVDMYKTWNVISLETLVIVNSQLSMYTKWCMQQAMVIDGQNHFLECTKGTLSECVNTTVAKKKVVTRGQLVNIGKMLNNASDEFMLFALFEGICGKDYCELVNLEWTDFNEKIVSLCTGRKIEISARLLELAEIAYNTYDYYPVTTDARCEKISLRAGDGKIIKDFPNTAESTDDFQRGRRIYRRLRRNFEYVGVPWLSGKDIIESGRVNFINTIAKTRGEKASDFVHSATCREIVENQFGDKFDLGKKNRFIDKYGEYLE